MSATTQNLVDWVQLRHDEQEQLQRRSPECFERLLKALQLNVESFKRLYGRKEVTVQSDFEEDSCRISTTEGKLNRKVTVALGEDCAVLVETHEGNREIRLHMRIVLGGNGQLQLEAPRNEAVPLSDVLIEGPRSRYTMNEAKIVQERDEVITIEEASRRILTPLLFPQAGSRQLQPPAQLAASAAGR